MAINSVFQVGFDATCYASWQNCQSAVRRTNLRKK